MLTGNFTFNISFSYNKQRNVTHLSPTCNGIQQILQIYLVSLRFPFEERTLHALIGFVFLSLTIFSKTWSLSCPECLKGGSLYGAVLEIQEVSGAMLHSLESTVIHSLASSSGNFLYLVLFSGR